MAPVPQRGPVCLEKPPRSIHWPATRSSVAARGRVRWLRRDLPTISLRVLGAISGLSMNWFVLRTLGMEQAGRFYVGIIFLGFASILGRGGLDAVLVRRLAAKRSDHDRDRTSQVSKLAVEEADRREIDAIVLFVVACAFASALVVMAFWRVVRYTMEDQPWVANYGDAIDAATILLPSVTVLHVFGLAWQGLGFAKLHIATIFLTLSSTTIACCVLGPLLQIITADDLINHIAMIIYPITAAAAAAWCCMGHRWSMISRSHIVSISIEAFDLFGVAVATLINRYLGQLLLVAFVAAEAIAAYSVIERTAAVIGFLLLVADALALPRFASLHGQTRYDQLRDQLRRYNLAILAAATPIAFGLFVWAEPVLHYLHPDLTGHAVLLRILVVGQCFNAATGTINTYLVATQRGRAYRNATLMGTVAAAIVGLILIPTLGLVGAAFAAAASQILSNTAAAIVVHRVHSGLASNPVGVRTTAACLPNPSGP